LLLGWGIVGFWVTRGLSDTLHSPALFALPAAALAAGGALGVARLFTMGFTRFAPSEESLAMSTVDLCGLIGTAAFAVDDAHGRVHVYDDFGTMHDCTARTAPGKPAIDRGARVLVVDYDAAKDQLIVEPAPPEWIS